MANLIPDDSVIRESEDLPSDLLALYDLLNPPLTKYEIVELGEPEQKYTVYEHNPAAQGKIAMPACWIAC